jgi:hypothetical protein
MTAALTCDAATMTQQTNVAQQALTEQIENVCGDVTYFLARGMASPISCRSPDSILPLAP